DWVSQDSYNVYPLPAESPNHETPLPPSDGRTLVTDPADATASQLGWHHTGSTSFTIMRGNNVHAYHDQDANNVPPSSEPSCGAQLSCDFPLDLTQAPTSYTDAAVANLFYWNNIVHDIQYQYGFDEQAGNFQVNNFGQGGVGGDDVRAEAQDGGGTNNATFLTPPDGQRPRMQVFLWNQTTPRHDGDFDNGLIVHEYGHGISLRQVGGPTNVNCLNNNQQPGEGWSDWLALVYTAEPGDQGPDPRGIGTYALGQPTDGPGIRTQRYSTDPAVNTHTYESINGMAIPHGVGEVWAQALWEVYWALVDTYGFDPNLDNVAGGAGNHRALLYVNEGLKNTACSPTFTDARDGIIQTAIDNFGGEDVCTLWSAFADFGLGVDAVSGGSNSTNPTNGFSVPASCVTPPPTPVCEAGSIDFTSFPVGAYSNQDGSGSLTIENNGDTLLMEGNRWVRSTQDFTVTPDTVLEFQYQSSSQGEIHGIGFDEDQTLTNDLRIFQFWGTQNWAGATQFTPRYSGSGDFESFSIPIGQSYTGTAMRLVFVNDKDAGTLDNIGRFACVRVLGATPTPPAVVPFLATFDGGTEGFSYLDDAFRGTSQPAYANGTFLSAGGNPGGGLSVNLGGLDNADIFNMSGGWQRTFVLTEPTELLVSFNYNLTQAPDYESDELSQALVSVNGVLFGQSPNDFVAQVVGNGSGGGPQSTGWQSVQVNIGTLPAGEHQLIIGGFSNKKTFNNESTSLLIDDVMVAVAAPPGLVTVPDVVGLSQGEAGEVIVAAGLVVGAVTTENSNTVPAGDVISQNPTGGTQVLPGSDVDLVISLGPVLVLVPNVVGLAQAAAEAAIEAAGLVVGNVTEAPSNTVPAGNVIGQNPLAGAAVIPGTMVDIVVSSGPAPADVIDWNTTATVAYSNQDS
ncbi:MAG: M36 family metallopeptidase, partial [Gemmatimonadetes bacterium]|nr:M36 family metallopeptidase [Gemmatimonadota bacterium]